MRSGNERRWIVATAAALGTIAIGFAIALFVVPSDQPKPAAPTAIATIKIAPSPLPEPTGAPPLATPAPTPLATPLRRPPHPTPTMAPDPDPVTITTTNSW